MYGKTPEQIRVVFPMKEGVIAGITDMQYLLQNLLKKGHQFANGSEYVIAVPTDVTEKLEKRAFCDLVLHSTAKAKAVTDRRTGNRRCSRRRARCWSGRPASF